MRISTDPSLNASRAVECGELIRWDHDGKGQSDVPLTEANTVRSPPVGRLPVRKVVVTPRHRPAVVSDIRHVADELIVVHRLPVPVVAAVCDRAAVLVRDAPPAEVVPVPELVREPVLRVHGVVVVELRAGLADDAGAGARGELAGDGGGRVARAVVLGVHFAVGVDGVDVDTVRGVARELDGERGGRGSNESDKGGGELHVESEEMKKLVE